MSDLMTTAVNFFLAHSVVICLVLGFLLIISSCMFSVILKKYKKIQKSTQEANPDMDELEKMYMDSLRD